MSSNERKYYLRAKNNFNGAIWYYTGNPNDEKGLAWTMNDTFKKYYTENDLKNVLAYMFDKSLNHEFSFEILEKNNMSQVNKEFNVF